MENANSQNVTRTDGATRKRNRTGQRLSRFCFTLNNYSEDELTWLKSFDCKWIVIGREVGESGTPHLQGACVLGKQIAFSTIKRMVGFARAHIETMRGSPQDSLEYCTKEDKEAFVRGDMPKPGKRNDIHHCVERLHAGESLNDLVQDVESASVMIRYHTGLNVVANMLKPDRVLPPLVYWIHGKTGLGKTERSIEFCDSTDREYWISHGSLQWFDGYCDQPVAILDDLRSNHAQFSFLLRLLDRYRFTVPIKGSFIKWTPDVIIITSPYDPEAMWSLRNDEDKRQLVRRCTRIWDMDDGVPNFHSWFREDDAARRPDGVRPVVTGSQEVEMAEVLTNLHCNEVLSESTESNRVDSADSDDGSVYDWVVPRRKVLQEWQSLEEDFLCQSDEWEHLIEHHEKMDIIEHNKLSCSMCHIHGHCCKHDGSCKYKYCGDCPFH